jgi:phosphatidate cytidylyltransferase
VSVALWEFYDLAEKGGYRPQKWFGIINGILVFLLFYFNAVGLIPAKMLLIPILPVSVMFISEMYRQADDNFKNIAFSLMGLIYVAVPFSTLSFLAVNSFTHNIFSPIFLFSFFLMIWANDTGAYLTGVMIGKHKLFERISPKKTWEGSGGGLVFTFLAGFLISLYNTDLNLWEWLGYAAIVVVFGTYGDLAESLIKRRTGVKDSGNILPGHGGMLDRFDSAILAAPVIFLYLSLLEFI